MKSILALITMVTVILSVFSFAKEEKSQIAANKPKANKDSSSLPTTNQPDVNLSHPDPTMGHSSPTGENLTSDIKPCPEAICNKNGLTASGVFNANCELGESNQRDPSCLRGGAEGGQSQSEPDKGEK